MEFICSLQEIQAYWGILDLGFRARGFYGRNTGIMEKKVETTIMGLHRI